jgi:hypothetical protein
MTAESWDTDQALLSPASGTEEEADDLPCVYRYGVTSWESSHPEPLDVALGQELPDAAVGASDSDDEWREVDADESFPGRLLADDAVADDDYARAVDDPEVFTVEELAMHIVDD